MDIKTKAEQYAEKFRLIPETKGWYQQKVDDFIAGYEEALRQFTVSGSLPISEIVDCGKDGKFKVCNVCGNAKRQ
jgi:hypothetical protein